MKGELKINCEEGSLQAWEALLHGPSSLAATRLYGVSDRCKGTQQRLDAASGESPEVSPRLAAPSIL